MPNFSSWLRACALYLLLLPSAWAISEQALQQLTPEQAYQQGKLLHWQYKGEQAKPLLKYAADKGHAKAALLYAAENFGGPVIQSRVEHQYMLKAAHAGNVVGMIALGNIYSIETKEKKKIWKQKSRAILKQRIEQGDARAGLLLFSSYFHDDLDQAYEWLKKGAELGYPPAQHRLAQEYQIADYGFFLLPGSRAKEIKRLYKAAAEQGYPPAMSSYASVLKKEGNYKEGWKWSHLRAEHGSVEGIYLLASEYSNIFNEELNGIKEDKVKGAGYYQVYLTSLGQDKDPEFMDMVNRHYQKVLATMTPEQKKQADQFAKDYLSKHTVRAFDTFWEWGVDYGHKPK